MSEFVMPANERNTSINWALTALVVGEAEKRVAAVGRTAVQKLCYFAQELGVPMQRHFRVYYYGPYSDDLAMDLELMVAEHTLIDISPDSSRYSNFKLAPEGHRLIEHQHEELENYRGLLTRVVEAFAGLSAHEMELLSTLHFVERRLKAEGVKNPARELVITEFRSVKEGRFSSDEVDHAYDAMRDGGLVG